MGVCPTVLTHLDLSLCKQSWGDIISIVTSLCCSLPLNSSTLLHYSDLGRLDGSPGIYENLEAMLYSKSKYGFVSKIQSMQLFEEGEGTAFGF